MRHLRRPCMLVFKKKTLAVYFMVMYALEFRQTFGGNCGSHLLVGVIDMISRMIALECSIKGTSDGSSSCLGGSIQCYPRCQCPRQIFWWCRKYPRLSDTQQRQLMAEAQEGWILKIRGSVNWTDNTPRLDFDGPNQGDRSVTPLCLTKYQYSFMIHWFFPHLPQICQSFPETPPGYSIIWRR